MLVSDFDYNLPAERIAQAPLQARADSRMLRVNRFSGSLQDCQFRDFAQLLRPNDLVVFNDTRVFPARIFARKGPLASSPTPGGKIEALLARQLSIEPNDWQCLVRPGRKVRLGDILLFSDDQNASLRAEVIDHGAFGERRLRFDPIDDFHGFIERIGHVPLPPYINRDDQASDKERYQTIYARHRGSVAAPTAGLHFTPEIFEQIKACGIETAEITLHVGLGTFQSVRQSRVEDHKLHLETYRITPDAADKIQAARAGGGRVIAIGTTTARTLEHAASAAPDGKIYAGSGEADIFIYPGHRFRAVNAMLTNFHLPRSTLLLMVCAFAGKETVLAAYNHAVAGAYRFYSYGDCMFLE